MRRAFATRVLADVKGARSAIMLTTDVIVDRRILLEAESLRQAGWDVEIVAPHSGVGAVERKPPLAQKALGVLYRQIRDRLPFRETLGPKVRELGWRFVMDPEQYHLKLFAGLAGAHADLVIAHDLPTLPPAFALADRLDVPVLYDSHELFVEQGFSAFEMKRWTEIERRYIARCAAVTTVNPSIADELETRYDIDGVKVVLNAEKAWAGEPLTGHFHRRFGLPAASKVLLFQGGLSADRNLENLVGAMRRVANPDIHLVMMGDGQIRTKLSRLAVDLGLADRVHFHPRVPQADLLAHTAAADAGVIPYLPVSLNNRYATPNKLFEFIAAKPPILASDLPEIRRIVSRYDIGLLADMGNERSIATAIDEMFRSSDRLAKWRENQAVAGRDINWEIEGAKFVKIAESVGSRS